VNGVSQTVQRPGFEVVVAGRGAAPSAPAPASSAELNQLLAQLDGRSGSSGGAQTVPTEQTVASSGVSQTISGNFNASLQQATAQFQTATAPTVNPTTVLTNTTVQSATSLSLNCAIQVTCTSQAQVVATTVSGQPVGGSNSVVLGGTTAPITPTTPPVTLVYAGRLKNTNGNGTARGFVAQGGTADIPYSGGTLSFPAGQPQNGVFNATFGNLGTISFPLVPGTNSFQGTSSQLGPVSGTSFLSPDNSFFYASLVPTNAPTERGFIFGGTAVNPSFYQPTGQTRILAFNVQPDAALQSAVPFIRNQAGGALPNASVSPFYIVSPATTGFGDVSTASRPRGLQASLAISGQGANQQSAIAVTTGTVGQVQSTGQPVFVGDMRGASQLSAFSPPVGLRSAVASTVDGAGNSFYGSNAISGFVLDQTQYNSTAPGSGIITNAVIPSTANEVQITGGTTAYGFAQPAVPTAVPAGVGASRTTQTITGNAGGLNFTSAQGQPYIVTGPISISTNRDTNKVQATINATAQTPSAGYNTLTYQFGTVGANAGRRDAFVDDRNFAVLESDVNPQQANGQTLVVNGDPTQAGKLYLVNANVAPPPNSLLNGAGASYCQCQFLQWGYWGGDLLTGNATNNSISRVDRGGINFWAAGPATPLSDIATLQGQNFVGTYAGHAIGSVSNNGANYVAAGGFNGTYSFGTRAANFTISNFDGNTFNAAGTVPLNGASYTLNGTAPRTGMTGTLNGTFYGPMAAETGGNFTLQSTLGVPYMASGIFAGKR